MTAPISSQAETPKLVIGIDYAKEGSDCTSYQCPHCGDWHKAIPLTYFNNQSLWKIIRCRLISQHTVEGGEVCQVCMTRVRTNCPCGKP